MNRFTILLTLTAALLRAQDQSATIEGKAVNALTGAPVAKVALTLRSIESRTPIKYTATSDAEGIFALDHIAPGRYTFSAEKPGFLKQSYGTPRATPLSLSEGQSVKDIVFKLTPQGVITGRVVDETGEPMSRVQLWAMQRGYSNGKRELQLRAGTFTNDIGEYRIANLAAGNYFLLSRGGDLIAGVLSFIHADLPSPVIPEKPEQSYTQTYYPSALDPAAAVAVAVTAGAEVRDIEIQARKTRVFRVRGRVIDAATGQPPKEASIMLTPRSENYRMISQMSRMGGPLVRGGAFEAVNVMPGSYYATAEAIIDGQLLYARESVDVVNRNVLDVVIRVPRAVNIGGRVRFSTNESSRPFPLEKIRVDLMPAEGFGIGESSAVAVKPDGSFVLPNVVPDKYRVLTGGAPAGAYLKSIGAGGHEQPDGILELSGGSVIEIVFAMGAARITGTVVKADDKPGAGAKVTLGPDDAAKAARIDLFRNATADQNGEFQISNVVPGNYKIFAWDEIESDAADDPQFLRRFEDKATRVRVEENGSAIVQLKAISAKDVAETMP